MKSLIAMLAALCVRLSPAAAQDATWSGEGSLSAGTTTGNTETTDIGVGVDLIREAGLWRYGLQGAVDYGEIDGEETKNRLFAGVDIDRQLNDRLFAFGRLSHERDEFTGFDSRSFIGGGLGYQVFDGEKTVWSVRGGPGLKIDEVKPIETTNEAGDAVTLPGETVESLGFILASDYAYAFNDNVSFSNMTDVLFAEESTQLTNSAAITASLTSRLSARLSFDVRHDTDPPEDFEATDTATRASIVYAF